MIKQQREVLKIYPLAVCKKWKSKKYGISYRIFAEPIDFNTKSYIGYSEDRKKAWKIAYRTAQEDLIHIMSL
jgi:transposase